MTTALRARASACEDLACDPIFEACGVTCESDGDCRDADLRDFTCDLRPLGEIDPRFAGDARPRGFCVAAMCR